MGVGGHALGSPVNLKSSKNMNPINAARAETHNGVKKNKLKD